MLDIIGNNFFDNIAVTLGPENFTLYTFVSMKRNIRNPIAIYTVFAGFHWNYIVKKGKKNNKNSYILTE